MPPRTAVSPLPAGARPPSAPAEPEASPSCPPGSHAQPEATPSPSAGDGDLAAAMVQSGPVRPGRPPWERSARYR